MGQIVQSCSDSARHSRDAQCRHRYSSPRLWTRYAARTGGPHRSHVSFIGRFSHRMLVTLAGSGHSGLPERWLKDRFDREDCASRPASVGLEAGYTSRIPVSSIKISLPQFRQRHLAAFGKQARSIHPSGDAQPVACLGFIPASRNTDIPTNITPLWLVTAMPGRGHCAMLWACCPRLCT